ncbi:MAG TPA: hypothetical protein VE994_15070 [Terriglobales bacterium]|nr:hypothetical protein [Terriglobales bacterium]
MADTALATPTTPLRTASDQRVLVAGIALASFSALLLELGLTRLFSVVLFYHFAFLAISVALLGLGAGGVFAYLMRSSLSRTDTRVLAGRICLAIAVAIAVLLYVVLHGRVSLDLTGRNFFRLTKMYVASAVPFFFTGVLFSVVFARETKRIPLLYGADLLGGALACLTVVPMLNIVGGPNTILLAGAAAAISAVLWSTGRSGRRWGIALAACFLIAVAINHSGRRIDVIYAKGLRRNVWHEVKWVKWNAISRIEVDQIENQTPIIVIDADAATTIAAIDPHDWQKWQKYLMGWVASSVNVLRPRGEYAIIGPGGGIDVLRAVANGSPNVTAIEINPIIANDVMRGAYADYSHHLYSLPEVHMHVSDGRSFIRSTKQSYDAIQMTLVDTWASTAAGAFALTENNLYTTQAFDEYLKHLKPDGMLAITRWEFKQPREALRVVSLGMEALKRIGVTDFAPHFMVLSNGPLNDDGRPVTVLVKKTPFTADEEATMRRHLAQYPDITPLYLPSSPGDNPFAAMIASRDPAAFAQSYSANVAPVSDDAPFFFFTLKTAQALKNLSTHHGMDWKNNLGVLVLGMVLLISIVAVLAFLILPLAIHGGRTSRPLPLLYFIAVGLGYILVEIAFIQRFVLFLGHPTYALTVVVFLLLLSSGAGSLVSRRWLDDPMRVRIPLVIITLALLAYVAALPILLRAMVGLEFFWKLLISGLVLAPLGFAMGMPFPAGLRMVAPASAQEDRVPDPGNAVEWAWAMNAASSVMGSVLAMVIAIHFGLNVTLACGAAAYLAALGLTATLPAASQSRA